MKKQIIRNAVSAMLVFIIVFQSAAAFALTSSAACAMDVYNERVLYEYNADEPLAPASMTKVMTAYIIYDKMNKGELNKATQIVCSENAAALSRDPVATNVPLDAGEAYTVDELLGAIMLPSACAACTLMGEYISGSEEEFAKLMNRYVYHLGLEAYYDDASGLSDNNRITARSMAKLASRFIREYPDILSYTSKPYIEFRGKKYNNTNSLLPGKTYEYPGADGLKTGTTTLAGKCLTATAVKDGLRIVGVTMNSKSWSARYTDIHSILDAGFSYANKAAVYADASKIFIDESEIPSFCYSGATTEEVIIAENLASYGFDIFYDAATRTVYITRDKQKQITPITDSYTDGQKLADVAEGSSLKVVLNDDGYIYNFEKVYDLSGYCAIPVNELSKIYRYSQNADEGHFNVN